MSETRTERVYAFIETTPVVLTALRQQGYPPSFEETLSGPISRPSRLDMVGQARRRWASGLQLHPKQVLSRLGRLERAGRLHFRPDRRRNLRLWVESAM